MHIQDLLSNSIIAKEVLQYTEAESLASFSLVSKFTKSLVEWHYAHSLRCVLASYVDNTDNFLTCLRHTCGCITGSEALKLLMNDYMACWKAKDMDISVPKGKASMLCSYLEKFEGYAPEAGGPCETQRTAYHQLLKRQRLASVTRLRNRRGRGIDILESATASCIAPLCDFHSTAVVNAIFPNKITCFFPSYTLRHRTIRNLAFQRKKDGQAVAKYQGRGWQPIANTMIVLEEDLLYANSWSIDVGSAVARRKSLSREAQQEWVKFVITWYALAVLDVLRRVWSKTYRIGGRLESIEAVEDDGGVEQKAVAVVV